MVVEFFEVVVGGCRSFLLLVTMLCHGHIDKTTIKQHQ